MKKIIRHLLVVTLLPAVIWVDVSAAAISSPNALSSKSSSDPAMLLLTASAPAPTPVIQQQLQVQNQQVVPKALVQLELELNKNTKYSVFSLPDPARLIVDIKDGTAQAEFDKKTLENTPIKGVRTAMHDNGTLRIVFDLKQSLAFSTKEISATENNVASSKMLLVVSLFVKDVKNGGKQS